MPPSKKSDKQEQVKETPAEVVEETAAEEVTAEGSPDAAVEEAAAVEDVPAQEDPAIETPALEADAVGMSPEDFLAQKGIFQTAEELIEKIQAMPEGQEKEEAKALFTKAMSQSLSAPTEKVIKSGGRVVRVRKFFGTFHDADFAADQAKEWGEAQNVSDATLDLLRSEFPGAEIEVTE